MVGLSKDLSKVRAEIGRISRDPKGPWSSTLILGETGVGKEVVARALFYSSHRGNSKLASVACGWLHENLIQDQIFGHVSGAFVDAKSAKDGLLATHSEGAIFFDYFDVAPKHIQGSLLRLMATPTGEKAEFTPLGTTEARKTNVWLMFATNVKVGTLIKEQQWREDFIYRFEDRVIHIPPLRDRIADLPALALYIWAESAPSGGTDDSPYRRKLPTKTVKYLCEQKIHFSGNVRSLRSLLFLVSSMAGLPAHNHHSILSLLKEVLSRGPEYEHWVGIIETPSYTGGSLPGDTKIQEITQMDERSTELAAEEIIDKMPNKERVVEKVQEQKKVRKTKGKTEPHLRLCRIIIYAGKHEQLTIKIVRELCQGEISEATATEDLRSLEDLQVLKKSNTSPQRCHAWKKNW